jgi:hypothetical protein
LICPPETVSVRKEIAACMRTGTAIPVEKCLRTTYHPDMEFVDGLVERDVGERPHSRLQAMLVMILGWREAERGFEVFTEQRISIQERRRYRIPDVCVKAVPYDPVPILDCPTWSSRFFRRMTR